MSLKQHHEQPHSIVEVSGTVSEVMSKYKQMEASEKQGVLAECILKSDFGGKRKTTQRFLQTLINSQTR